MSEIKSKKASEYIHEYIPWAYMTLAIKTIQIAEQEAEERHAKEIQDLRNRVVEAFCYSMQKGVSSCDRNKDKGCTMACRAYLNFTQKLTEKQ